MNLHRMPLEERPRERLYAHGDEALSLSELLAIILGSGTQGKSVIELSQEILSVFGSLKRLFSASIEELMEVKGIGRAKATQLKALFGLAKRYVVERDSPKSPIRSPDDAYHLLKGDLAMRKEEAVVALMRDVRGFAFHRQLVSVGTLTQAHMHPREVLYHALRYKAHSMILAHNHPSGDPKPSSADIALTRLLQSSSQLMGIRLDDHLIVGESSYTSLWKEGYLARENY